MSINNVVAKLVALVQAGPVLVIGGHGSGKFELCQMAARAGSGLDPASVALSMLTASQMRSDLEMALPGPGKPVIFHEIENVDAAARAPMWNTLNKFLKYKENPVFFCAVSEDSVPYDILRVAKTFDVKREMFREEAEASLSQAQLQSFRYI